MLEWGKDIIFIGQPVLGLRINLFDNLNIMEF